jgi:hypothetical protein
MGNRQKYTNQYDTSSFQNKLQQNINNIGTYLGAFQSEGSRNPNKSNNDNLNEADWKTVNRMKRAATELGGDRRLAEDERQVDYNDLYKRNSDRHTAVQKELNRLGRSDLDSFIDINGNIRAYNSKDQRNAMEGRLGKDSEDVLKYLESQGIYAVRRHNKKSEIDFYKSEAANQGLDESLLYNYIDDPSGKTYKEGRDFKINKVRNGLNKDKIKELRLRSYDDYLNSDEDADTYEYYDENGNVADRARTGDILRNYYADKNNLNAEGMRFLNDQSASLINEQKHIKNRDIAKQDLERWDEGFNQEKHGMISKGIHKFLKGKMTKQLNTMNHLSRDKYFQQRRGLGNSIVRTLAGFTGLNTDRFSIIDLKARIHRDYVDFSKRNVTTYKPISKLEVSLLEDSLNSNNKYTNFSVKNIVSNKENPYLNWDIYSGV